jgi:ferredoxin
MKTNFKSVTLYYFSGTGNAKSAAHWMAEDVRSKGLKVTVLDIATIKNEDISVPEKDSLVGFFFPTHGFNAPPIVLSFLARFPRGNNRVFWANTRAGMKLFRLHTPGISGIAQLLPALLFFLKGYITVGWRPLDMPSNWISIHPALRKKAVEFIFKRCRKTVSKFCDKVLSGKTVCRGLLDLPLDLAISPISILYYFFGRFFLAKTFVATGDCDHCGLCLERCPVGAIKEYNDRLYWKFTCESCMQCMNHCHKNAIETSHGFTAVLWWIAFSLVPLGIGRTIFRDTIEEFVGSEVVTGWVFEIVAIAAGLVTVLIGYWVLHFLMKLKPFNKLITWTSLTHLPFWGRYKCKEKLEDS